MQSINGKCIYTIQIYIFSNSEYLFIDPRATDENQYVIGQQGNYQIQKHKNKVFHRPSRSGHIQYK